MVWSLIPLQQERIPSLELITISNSLYIDTVMHLMLYNSGYETLTQRVLISSDSVTKLSVQLNSEISKIDYHKYDDLHKIISNITSACSTRAELVR